MTTALGLPVLHYPCTRHPLIPKKIIMTLWNCHLNHRAPGLLGCLSRALLCPLHRGQRNPRFQSRGTAPMWHCPLLSVAAGTPSGNTGISVSRGIPEGPESRRSVPGGCCIHEKQQSPGGVSACSGFPFSLAGSRSEDYFWRCLTLERVTHAQGITPGPAPRCGQRK